MVVRVGIVGYGTIGKRVAQAVMMQDDMVLVGVVKRKFNYEVIPALLSGVNLYALDENSLKEFEEHGSQIRGTLMDLLDEVDVVVDATPAGTGLMNSKIYEKAEVKSIFQGGEDPRVAEVSFSSLCNYNEAIGKKSVRVVSCNTTGLLRLVCSLQRSFDIKSVNALIIRRATDPKDVSKGPINSLVLKPVSPGSHHGRDASLVVKDVEFTTRAIIAPTTLMHVHYITIKFGESVKKEDVLHVLEESPRILVINSNRTGISSTSQIIELFRDLGRPRSDVPEVVLWEDSIGVDGKELSLVQAVHQESIVVPENIDAIRATAAIVKEPRESIRKTDNALGLLKQLEVS